MKRYVNFLDVIRQSLPLKWPGQAFSWSPLMDAESEFALMVLAGIA